MTSAEQRATLLMSELAPNGHFTNQQHALIAQAIRQAENDKLEEAARLCDGITENLSERRTQMHASPYFAAQIRALKAEDTP